MKTITKIKSLALMLFCVFQTLNAQPPVAAPVPTKSAANVKSIYSDAYTNITAITKALVWGQGTVTSFITPFTNDHMMKFTSLDWVPIQCDTKLNIADMDSIHFDVYLAAQYANFQFGMYSYAYSGVPVYEIYYTPFVSGPTGQWISVNMPLQYFKDKGMDCKGINLLRFKGKMEVYVDNIYAFKGAPSAVNEVKEDQSFKIYPTVVSDNLIFESAENITKMSLYNTTGQLVKAINVNSDKTSVDLSSLKAGSYIISAQSVSGKVLSKRIVKL